MKEKKITIFESVLRVGKEKFSRDLQIIGCLAVNGILFDFGAEDAETIRFHQHAGAGRSSPLESLRYGRFTKFCLSVVHK